MLSDLMWLLTAYKLPISPSPFHHSTCEWCASLCSFAISPLWWWWWWKQCIFKVTCVWTLIFHPHFFPPLTPGLNLMNLFCTIIVIICHWDFELAASRSSSHPLPSFTSALHFPVTYRFPEICFCTERPEWSNRFTDRDDDATRTSEWVAMLLSFEGFRN